MFQKKWCAVVAAVVASSGCATLRYDRLGSYQALPIAAEEFEALEVYEAVLVPKPFSLHVSERGTAWLLLVRRLDGAIEQSVAVEYGLGAQDAAQCPSVIGQLLAIVPGDPVRYTGARTLLVAHDGKRCFGANGQAFPCARADAWARSAPLSSPRITVTSRSDERDRALREWYGRQTQHAAIRERNTTLSDEDWRRVSWEESIWKDLLDSSPSGIGSGVVAGMFSGPLAGVVVGGVAILIRFPFLVIAESEGPEYGDAPMSAENVAALAEYLRQCGAASDHRSFAESR